MEVTWISVNKEWNISVGTQNDDVDVYVEKAMMYYLYLKRE